MRRPSKRSLAVWSGFLAVLAGVLVWFLGEELPAAMNDVPADTWLPPLGA